MPPLFQASTVFFRMWEMVSYSQNEKGKINYVCEQIVYIDWQHQEQLNKIQRQDITFLPPSPPTTGTANSGAHIIIMIRISYNKKPTLKRKFTNGDIMTRSVLPLTN